MPKKQSTAKKRARSAARVGAKYTTALRENAVHPLPPRLELVDYDALPEGERMVVDCLRALAAEGKRLPVRIAEPEPEVAQALAGATAAHRFPRWKRWATVEAAVDGYVLRETRSGPTNYTSRDRGPRIPVPVRRADGTVTVVAMPQWAWRTREGRWLWAHTGWPVEAPGKLEDPPQVFSPARELRWQVAVWPDKAGSKGEVLGEDYAGSAPYWQTVGWCTSREDARLIARAYAAYRGEYARADVVEHGTDNGFVSLTRDTYVPVPDAPEPPRPATPPGPRPASPDRSEVPEPAWYPLHEDPPKSSLVVWTGTGWRTLVWTDWQASNTAIILGIGAGGPYEWAEGWGPRHPDRDLHDWTQEGREMWRLFPDPTHEENMERRDAARRAEEDALMDALADRGSLTRDQAIDRLARGGGKYRHVLTVGQAVISRALHTARRALPEGPERTAVRHALDDLMHRHVLPADAERIANEQLDSEIEADRDPELTAWCRRAVGEYVRPAPDPVEAGVEGFLPA